MSGETDLSLLVAGMAPLLDPQTYVYGRTADRDHPLRAQAIATVEEAEGLTLILPAHLATPDLTPVFPCRRITLTIHSALEAVGLTAVFAGALARAGIGCNVVAGYTHDHLLVPADRADDAMAALRALSSGPTQGAN
jgi:uncharacterized protein